MELKCSLQSFRLLYALSSIRSRSARHEFVYDLPRRHETIKRYAYFEILVPIPSERL